MAYPNLANGWATTLAASQTNVATVVDVASVAGIPARPFQAVILAEGANTDEIVTVTGLTGVTLTMTRATEANAVGSTSASAHASGATIMAVLTKQALADLSAVGTDAAAAADAVADAAAVAAADAAADAAAADAVIDGHIASHPGVSVYSATLTADVLMTNANQFYTVLTLSGLAAGTYVVIGRGFGTGPVTTLGIYSVEGTKHWGQSVDRDSMVTSSSTVHAVVTLTGTSDIRLVAACSSDAKYVKDVVPYNGYADLATAIVAIKVA